MKSKTPLALMEQLVMVLVFALAAALCVSCFVAADRLSDRYAVRDDAVLEAVFTDKRYGVISEVVVNDRSTGTQQLVRDEKFIAEGGCCRRVMSVYSRTAHRTAARTGQQTIELSGMDRRVLSGDVSVRGLMGYVD